MESVICHLRTGKSPKEVAATLHLEWKCVQQIITRHRQARCAFIETYSMRHPRQPGPPQKILQPLAAFKKIGQL